MRTSWNCARTKREVAFIFFDSSPRSIYTPFTPLEIHHILVDTLFNSLVFADRGIPGAILVYPTCVTWAMPAGFGIDVINIDVTFLTASYTMKCSKEPKHHTMFWGYEDSLSSPVKDCLDVVVLEFRVWGLGFSGSREVLDDPT